MLAGCVAPRTPPPAAQPRPAPTAAPRPTPAPTPPAAPPAPVGTTAVEAGVEVVAGAPIPLDAARALSAFRTSCRALERRTDQSGLTQPGDWREACAAAATVAPGGEPGFFANQFAAVRVGGGDAFITGYYEPEIAGSRAPSAGYAVPVYRRPPDLVETRTDGRRARGRLQDRRVVPHFSRGEIEDGALAGQGLELAWAADPVDLFFVEIQGSGRLRLPDGGVLRIGYDGQNGHPYTAIGALLRQRGELPPGIGMAEIVGWLRADPARGRALMRENASFVFFRELTGPGPIGAMGVAVTPNATVAADPRFTPLGAPVLIEAETPAATGLWVAQDTGGAIRGANRFDTFWGAGAAAQATAGSMSSRGRALVLIPRAAAARLGRGDAAAGR
nr:murein transglycosylase A [Sphingomonas jejuensis]